MLLSHWAMNAVGRNNCRELAQLIHESPLSNKHAFRIFVVPGTHISFTRSVVSFGGSGAEKVLALGIAMNVAVGEDMVTADESVGDSGCELEAFEWRVPLGAE